MKILSVDQHASKLLRNLSASDQRLCLLARALVKNPVLLILDEPCQGFSEAQKEYFKHLLNTICGLVIVSLIYVSHYTNEIPDVLHRCSGCPRAGRLTIIVLRFQIFINYCFLTFVKCIFINPLICQEDFNLSLND